MKIRKSGVIAGIAALALALSACGGGGGTSAAPGTDTGTDPAPTDTDPTDDGNGGGGGDGDFSGYKIANIVNGYLGDQGFFDDAESGIQAMAAKGAETQTLQADPNNPAQWKANLESVSGKYDIIVAGTSQMLDLMNEIAPKYPDQHYILYDQDITQPNVAGVTYAQNEGAFLAGVLAALVTTDTEQFPMANDQKIIGAVGGMDIPVINDFMEGYKAGAAAVDPEIQVLISYAGSFADSQKGYDQAMAMFGQGADVVFQVAGGTGIGALQAAKDANAYGIGVDQNQNQLQPGHILASMLKNVGASLEIAIAAAKDGTLKYGENTIYGLANDGVGLDFADNNDLVPQDIITKIEEYKQKVVDGEITVPSTTG